MQPNKPFSELFVVEFTQFQHILPPPSSIHGLLRLLGWLSETACGLVFESLSVFGGLAFVCLSVPESRGYAIEEEEAVRFGSWIWFILCSYLRISECKKQFLYYLISFLLNFFRVMRITTAI